MSTSSIPQQVLNQHHNQHAGYTYMTGNTLDRFNLHRKDNAKLDEVLQSKHARFLCYHKLQPLVTTVDSKTGQREPAWLTHDDLKALNIADVTDQTAVLLGIDTASNLAYHVMAIKDSQVADSLKSHNNNSYEYVHLQTEYVDVRTLLSEMDVIKMAIVGMGRSILEWHSLSQFCGVCGSTTHALEGGAKRKCGTAPGKEASNGAGTGKQPCGRKIYPRVDPVIIVLCVSHDGKRVLLGRKKSFPPGVHTCIAGFVDVGESVEEAAVREIYEETSVRAKPESVRYVAAQPWPVLGGQLMIGLHAVADEPTEADHSNKSDDPSHPSEYQKVECLDGEMEHCGWFSGEECQSGLALSNDPSIWKGNHNSPDDKKKDARFRVPGKWAIAHQLISTYANKHGGSNGQNGSTASNL